MTEDLVKIGLRLKSIRKQLGLTQSEISEKYGVPLATLKSWEWGTKEIGAGKLINYLKIFENYGVYVDLNSILSDSGANISVLKDPNNTQNAYSYLRGLESSNALFYAEPTGLILFFNSRYRSLLNIEKENCDLNLLSLHHLFNPEQVSDILTIDVPKKNISLIGPLSNPTMQLQLELYSNYDIYNRIIGILGFLSPTLTTTNEIK